MIVTLLQQLSVVRANNIQSSNARDVLIKVLAAKDDTLVALRKHDRQMTRCCRIRHRKLNIAELLGPPEPPPPEGTLLKSVGKLAGRFVHALGSLIGV